MEQTAKLILSFLLIFNSQAFAASQCPNNVTVVHQGDKAVCDGFLFSGPAEKQAENDRDDAAYYKALTDKLTDRQKAQDDENAVLEKRLKLYMDETQSLSKDIATHDSNETWIRLGYFVLGVVGTGLIVRNLRQ